ncbi:MAG: glutamate-cysteine ligase family protein [Myxococcota bacterium]|nr:glutamate-cysteine ligase family protein [Myxococcota bacterium]
MLESLPDTPPPIVGSNPFTGVDPALVLYTVREPEVVETEEQFEQQNAPKQVFYNDILPEGIPPIPAGDGHPFNGVGRAIALPSESKEAAPIEAAPYDDRGLPNEPPPVRTREGMSVGVHTHIPIIEKEAVAVVEEKESVKVKDDLPPVPPAPPEIPKPSAQEIAKYTAVFFDHFSPAPITWRHVGRISEYPIVRKNGRAADLAELWPSLKPLGFAEHREPNGMLSGLVGDSFSYRCGIGRGTIEIHCPAQLDLHALQDVHRKALGILVDCASKRRLHILGYGIQPMNPPTTSLLNHIFHLHSLHTVIGEPWLVASVRALERVQVSVSQAELVERFNLGHLIEPVFLALFGNAPIHSGEDSYLCESGTQMQDSWPLDDLGRHSMRTSALKGQNEYIEEIMQRRFMLRRDAQGWLEPGEGAAWLALQEEDAREQWFIDHLACDWGPVIPKMENGHLEWRAASQQPFDAQMAPSALVLGLMEHSAEMLHFVDSFFPEPPEPFRFGLRMAELIQLQMEKVKDPWPSFREWRTSCINYGLAGKEAFTGLIEGTLQIAQDGLEARGLGEEVYLEPLWLRLEKKQNPAQELRRIFARKGIEGLLSFCSLPSV